MKYGYDAGSMQRGNGMDSMPWHQTGTVSFASIMGPVGGQAVAERASVYPIRRMTNGAGIGSGILTLPVIIAMGVLVWYAVRSYE